MKTIQIVRERYSAQLHISDKMEQNKLVVCPGSQFAEAPRGSVVPFIPNAPSALPKKTADEWRAILRS